MARRALHYVFKIGDRNSSIKFYREILGMKVLRHEEFEDGCKATCNGPYDGKWSKTMIGYGDEDSHFVLELTYNYGIMNYTKGNDFVSITINSRNAIDNVKKYNWPIIRENGDVIVESPGGYQIVLKSNDSNGLDPVDRVTLASSNLQNSLNYWHDLLGMKIYYKDDKSVLLGYQEQQCKLELVDIGKPVDHAKAFGRIAFSCPMKELPEIEDKIKNANQTILTPLVSLDTPGKATVQVVILADPDGHEICFVGDEAFRQLSVFDPEGDKLLNEAISKDQSDEWFKKKGISKDII